MDIKEIQHLIKFVAKSGVKEVKLEMEDVKITIKTGSSDPLQIDTNSLVQQVQTVPSPAIITSSNPSVIENSNVEEKVATEEENLVDIKSPIIGTFYRKSAPDKPPFVQVGDTIKEGDVLCVIEAMKLFNEIESEVSGTIVKILVDDASPVEFDQPLFVIKPS